MFNCEKTLNECKARCCGLMAFTKEFVEEHKDKVQRETEEVAEGLTSKEVYCIFLSEDYKCMIYDERPDVCKQYGLDEKELPCAYLKPNGKIRSEAGRRKFQRIIDHTVDDSIKTIKNYIKKL